MQKELWVGTSDAVLWGVRLCFGVEWRAREAAASHDVTPSSINSWLRLASRLSVPRSSAVSATPRTSLPSVNSRSWSTSTPHCKGSTRRSNVLNVYLYIWEHKSHSSQQRSSRVSHVVVRTRYRRLTMDSSDISLLCEILEILVACCGPRPCCRTVTVTDGRRRRAWDVRIVVQELDDEAMECEASAGDNEDMDWE